MAYAARVQGGRKEVVGFLLEKWADPRIKDCWSGQDALSLAVGWILRGQGGFRIVDGVD